MGSYRVFYHKQFIKAYKKLSLDDKTLVDGVVMSLSCDESLEAKCKDHKLKGVLKDFRECHIKPDLLLIYEKDKEILELNLLRLGSHSSLFK
ncbi:type II toxin-antitoxin system YafQ family toxin [Helicobacter himalayensis]|uniref:type II toxin-antitoxin system YafQ family toxin n=1 Tax=Helicobacter himalayensis TaxID=1591088 RepID=UPI003D6F8129